MQFKSIETATNSLYKACIGEAQADQSVAVVQTKYELLEEKLGMLFRQSSDRRMLDDIAKKVPPNGILHYNGKVQGRKKDLQQNYFLL